MKTFWKYFFILSGLIILLIFYLFKTNMGHQNLGYLIEYYLSGKTYNKIEVDSFSLEKYPHLLLELKVNDTAKLTLKGRVSKYNIEMDYHLVGDSFKFNDLHFKDKIDVEGNLSGVFSSLKVNGYGKIFDGEIQYSFVNIPKKIKDIDIQMKKIDNQKLLKFFEQESFVKGLADIDTKFKCFSRHNKQGKTKIYMQRAFIPQLETNTSFVLNSTIDFQNIEYRYTGDINSNIGSATISNGYYHEGKKIANADYKVHLTKPLDSYQGKLDANGSLMYDNNIQLMTIKGKTSEFGGELSYLYKKDNIGLKLKAVSLERLLKHFSYPVLFSSKVYGNVNFNIEDKILIINTNLKETRFLASKLTDILASKLGVDILSELYDQSYFSADYQNNILSSTLQIDNIKNYIYLTDIKINTLNSTVHSKFRMKVQGEELSGKIHGTLTNPKVWINKRKFFEFQVDKHLSSWLSTDK